MSLSPVTMKKILDLRGDHSEMTAQQYNDGMTALFKRWNTFENTAGTPFVTDGVLNPEVWFRLPTRVLFVLKEAYDEEWNADWSLINYALRKQIRIKKPTWKRLSLWAGGILGEGQEYYSDLIKDQGLHYFGNDTLQRIAVVNLKKYNGKSKSSDAEIIEHAKKYREFHREQIAICDPTVIVCGGTGDALQQVFDFGKKTNVNEEWFYHFYLDGNTILHKRESLGGHEVLVLDYYHPQAIMKDMMLYSSLMAIYRHAREDQMDRLRKTVSEET